MAIVLPQQPFFLASGEGKSYYENRTGRLINAAITVFNQSSNPVQLVITLVNAPQTTYTIPGQDSITIDVNGLLVAALLATGPTSGTINLTTSDV
jgi:hypothetical protein